MERFLFKQALTLIRAFEAGARTSMRTMGVESSPIETLAEETANSDIVAYVWLVDERGRKLAIAGEPADLLGAASVQRVLAASEPLRRFTADREGHEVF
jgi:two-component system sensor histidine kinase HydH